jgi:hypothetical protein
MGSTLQPRKLNKRLPMPLSPWNNFFQAVKKQDLKLSVKQSTRFSRAHARLRVARRFQNVNLKGVSSLTERGYTTGIAIFLAYSGMEALANAMEEKPRDWKHENPDLAERLRHLLNGLKLSHLDREEGIGWLLDNKTLLEKLQEFQDRKSDNVFLIAQSLRHMVAHGSFTTHGLKMFTKRECDAVEELRQLIFLSCDQRLNQWLDQQLKADPQNCSPQS